MQGTKDTRHKLRLHPAVIAWLCSYFVLVFGGLAFLAVWRDDYSILDRLVLNIAFSVAFIAVPSYCVWRFTRSNKAGNITCVVMVALMYTCVGMGAVLAFNARDKSRELDRAYSDFDQVIDSQSTDDLIARMERGEDVSDEVNQRLDEFSNAADRIAQAGGEDEQALAVMANAARRIRPTLNVYMEKTQALIDAGGTELTTLATREAIEARLTMLAEVTDATQAFSDAYMQQEEYIRGGLRSRGIPSARASYLISQWKMGAQPESAYQVRQLELRLFETQTALLVFLRDRYGTWAVDQDGMILFDQDSDIQEFDRLYQEENQALNSLEAKQREMRDTIRRMRDQS